MKKIRFKKATTIGEVEAEGFAYKTANGIDVALHKEGNVWYATELTTGKLATIDDTNLTIKAVKAEVEKRSPAILKLLRQEQAPKPPERKSKKRIEREKRIEAMKKKYQTTLKGTTGNYPQVWDTKKQAESAKRNGEALGYEVELKEVSKKRKDKKPRKEKKSLYPDPFAHADDVYITKSKIAVTTTTKKSAKRGYTKTTQTKYYVQSAANLRKLKAARGGTVRVGRTGNKYKSI